MQTQFEKRGEITVSLPSGNKAKLPLYYITFRKWIDKPPDFNYGGKPFVDYENKAVFAELAILKLLIADGWNGVWVETYGGTNFMQGMPKKWKLAENNIFIPKDKETILKNIWKAGNTTACFDVFAWKDNDILFCESKHKGKDRLTNAQTKFIEGALLCGIKEESLLIIEWDFE